MDAKTNANLIAAALDGDAQSFSRLCDAYFPALVAIAYSQLTDRDLAEDAAQEALLAAYRGITQLKRPERFSQWLTTICRNIAIDMAKGRRRSERIEFTDNDTAPQPPRDDIDSVAVVRSVIAHLKPELRDVVYLRFYNQMSYSRIAEMLDISEEAVNGRLRRARNKIRRELQKQLAGSRPRE